VLTLSNVTKRFGKKTAIYGVDLNLLPGERLCLMGPNGAGKTTLMRMIVGMARPTEGSVLLFGGDPIEEPGVRRHLGYLSDKPYIYDKLTSREHLRLHAALYDLPAEEIANKGVVLLNDLEMGGALDQRAETFSFGMQKKLALVLALVHEPDLLVLDEPLNGLDPDSADRMEESLLRYSGSDRSIVLSTHSVEFAARFASRFAIMREGRLELHTPRGESDAEWVRSLLARGGTSTENSERLNGERA
jgi:ABC-2 type transport system ATP-binding protein